MADAASVLSSDPAARLVGRVWSEAQGGPCVVAVRNGALVDITRHAPTMAHLLDAADPVDLAASASGAALGSVADALPADDVYGGGEALRLLAPCDLQALKAAGVTFVKSMLERVIEEAAAGDLQRAEEVRQRVQTVIGDRLSAIVPGSPEAEEVKQVLIDQDIWSQYLEVGIGPDAEVFTKSQPMSSVGHGDLIGLHPRSTWNNPEPEIVLAMNGAATPVGAALGNDVNLRDFEGRSALLLGKAKDNNASCAIGPFIRLFDDAFTLADVKTQTVALTVTGTDDYVLEGASAMSQISRTPADLVTHAAGTVHQYPDGFMLFLGTMFAPTEDRDVPGNGFTHKPGDIVTVSTPTLGALQNTVTTSDQAPPWTFGTRALMKNLAGRGLL